MIKTYGKNFRLMTCSRCNQSKFDVQISNSCDNCSMNGAYSKELDAITHNDERIKAEGLLRDQVYENGECEIGQAFGCGCYVYTCLNCGKRHHESLQEV